MLFWKIITAAADDGAYSNHYALMYYMYSWTLLCSLTIYTSTDKVFRLQVRAVLPICKGTVNRASYDMPST
jgi:hypothetical protein